jgi:PKD repeat protein
VTESNDYRTRLFDAGGNYLLQWGSYGSGNGQFKFPTGITTSASGNVYVIDEDNGRIEVFSPSGSYITQWGTYGTGAEELSSPKGIAINAIEQAYVAEYSSYRVHVFSKVFGNIARFTAYPRWGTAPLTVQFTDISGFNATEWNWDFGDGNITNATWQNPVHTYNAGGTYSVSLNASNTNGYNSSTKTDYISVNFPAIELFYTDKNPLLNGESQVDTSM